jgi:hypothetical protein
MLVRVLLIIVYFFSGIAFAAPAPGVNIQNVPAMEEETPMESIAHWTQQCLDICSADEKCRQICINTSTDLIGCAGGYREYCSNREGDLTDIDNFNAQQKLLSSAPLTHPPEIQFASSPSE